MTTSSTEVPMWPEISATIDHTGAGEVVLNGMSYPVTETSSDAGRTAVRNFVVAEAASKLNRPVRLHTSDDLGEWDLIIHPDGAIEDITSSGKSRKPKTVAEPEVTDVAPSPEVSASPLVWDGAGAAQSQPVEPIATPSPPAPPVAVATQQQPSFPATQQQPSFPATQVPATLSPATTSGPQVANLPSQASQISSDPLVLRPSQLPSFLQQSALESPATQGVRGVLSKVGFRTTPSEAERIQRLDQAAVSQHWPGTRTIAVVNGKGGANKTPTTALLAAAFARFGGAGVLAWDNNETRGTLGWRTEQGPHQAHVHDLLKFAPNLLAVESHLANIDAFVHHQTHDRYAVLRSNPELLAHVSRLSAESFDTIHSLTQRYFRLVFIDSGNDESSENWRRMIDRSDHIVIATTTRPEHAEAARLLLDALFNGDKHSSFLASTATVIISQADKEEADAEEIAAHFAQITRAAVTIPYDRGMRSAHLRWDTLQPTTARAWLHAAAQVASGL